MGLPKQVQKQADAVAQFEQQVTGTPDEPVTPPDEPTPTDITATPESPSPAPVVAEAPKPTEDAELWKQRFLSLQGMFNSQVPQLQQQVKELTNQLQYVQAPKQPEQSTKTVDPLVTKTDVDSFGEDLIDMARRVARDEFRALAASYEEKVSSLEGQLAQAAQSVGKVAEMQHKTTEERFFDSLGARLPKWKDIQDTPACQQWLTTRVPGTPITWNDALQDAARRYDLDAVIEVFSEFQRLHAPPAQPQRTARSSKDELQRQVAPARSGVAANTTPTEKSRYTGSQYQAESQRLIKLAQTGRHEEAAQLEAELNAALTEGRVSL